MRMVTFVWLVRTRCSFLALEGASCAKLTGRFLTRRRHVPTAWAAMAHALEEQEGGNQDGQVAVGEDQVRELQNGCR